MKFATQVIDQHEAHQTQWVTVESADWKNIASELHAQGFVRCEWLKAIHIASDEFKVFTKVASADLSETVVVVAICTESIDSLTEVYKSAEFHERECTQLLGIQFTGTTSMEPAFVTDFEGFPLRRDFALTERVDHEWPGQVDPEKNTRRRPALPPGVFQEWIND